MLNKIPNSARKYLPGFSYFLSCDFEGDGGGGGRRGGASEVYKLMSKE